MNTYTRTIFYGMLLLTQLLSCSMQQLPLEYQPNVMACSVSVFEKLRKRKLCQTLQDPVVHSSKRYRHLAFEALTNCGHPHPETVMLINDPHYPQACSGKFYAKQYVSINYDEFLQTHYSYGLQRATMHHEAAHIINQEYATDKTLPQWHLESQNSERNADYISVIVGRCVMCSRAQITQYLEFHTHDKHLNAYLKKYQYLTIQDLDQISRRDKKKLITQCYKISKKRINKEHPINLERALRMHQASHKLNGALCAYHTLSHAQTAVSNTIKAP